MKATVSHPFKPLSLIRALRNRLFTLSSYASLGVLLCALFFLLFPILSKGTSAYLFKSTIEYRRAMLEQFNQGNPDAIRQTIQACNKAREPIYAAFESFDAFIKTQAATAPHTRQLRAQERKLRTLLTQLLGPFPGARLPSLPHARYGVQRWSQAQKLLQSIHFDESWDYSDDKPRKLRTPRRPYFRDTPLEPIFDLLEQAPQSLLAPRLTFYPGFLIDSSLDAHYFGGIGPEVLGTLYLLLLALLFAVPFALGAALYFHEYAPQNLLTKFLRSCVNTLAGVPSVVFGLFGLAFFIGTLHLSQGKSVVAGALTLALLILPLLLRSTEEALAAVPATYREASLALGASRWYTLTHVLLPAAAPGILTGIVLSMGRAAGETAPIIFTAAVSVGRFVRPSQLLTTPTPALSWNLYNLCTEHQAPQAIAHVQYGMAATLLVLVLLFNAVAFYFRAKLARKLQP